MEFRTLHADEIECRISTASEKGASLLLYKDARVDQNILDETVGPMNWQRHHLRDNANCVVAIWDDSKQQWIEKEDTGKESYTEAEKGLASDSFKRACFNWGIGRELYTAPFIWIEPSGFKEYKFDGKLRSYDRFEVSDIDYDDKRQIIKLIIRNTKTHKIVFSLAGESQKPTEPDPKKEYKVIKKEEEPVQDPGPETQAKIEKQLISPAKLTALKTKLKNEGIPEDKIKKLYKVKDLKEITEKQFANINAHIEDIKKA